MGIEIIDMVLLDATQKEVAARLLHEELGYSIDESRNELAGLLKPERYCFAALNDQGSMVGWIGCYHYYAKVWELHPLAVSHKYRHQGIGRMLVEKVEETARSNGAATLYLGTDDDSEEGKTSFSDVDLYEDLPSKLRDFEPGSHASAFYLRIGFSVVGVIPDANGSGKPDILMTKRL